MHNTIDYSKSPAPQFDAVQDVKDWLGEERYAKLIDAGIGRETNCGRFALYCSFAGIKGFPVKAWYEHFHGQGSWKPEQLEGL